MKPIQQHRRQGDLQGAMLTARNALRHVLVLALTIVAWPAVGLAEPVVASPANLAQDTELLTSTAQRPTAEQGALMPAIGGDVEQDGEAPQVLADDLPLPAQDVLLSVTLSDRPAQARTVDGLLVRDALLFEGARFRDEQLLRRDRDEQQIERVDQGAVRAQDQGTNSEAQPVHWDADQRDVSTLRELFQTLRANRSWILACSLVALLAVWLASRRMGRHGMIKRIRIRTRKRRRVRIRLRRNGTPAAHHSTSRRRRHSRVHIP